MKIFEVEFRYDDETGLKDGEIGTWKNPFRVRIPFPKNELYSPTYWSENHRVIRNIWLKKYNPLINPDSDSYQRRYWIHTIRRVS